MRDQSLETMHVVEAGPIASGGGGESHGIGFPRLYDLILLILTRGRDRAYREHVLDLAGLAPGDRVLDVGCGTGTQAVAAWRRVQPDGSVVGVDVSPKMLAAARRKARRAGVPITLHQADATALPFDDRRFDVVTMVTVLHMVPEARLRPSLLEARRVLRPGGRLLLVDYAGELESRKGWVAKHGPHGRFDLHALREPVAEAGFEAIEGGQLDWLSLHFLRAERPRAQ